MMEELQKIKKSGSIQFKLDADTSQTTTSQDDLDNSTNSKRNLKTNSSHKLMKFFAAAEDEIQAVVATVSSVTKTPSHRGGTGPRSGMGSDPQTDTDTDITLPGQRQEQRQGTGDNANSSPGRSQKKVEQFFGGLDQGHVKERKYTKSYNKVAKLFDLADGGEAGQVGALVEWQWQVAAGSLAILCFNGSYSYNNIIHRSSFHSSYPAFLLPRTVSPYLPLPPTLSP